MTITTCKVHKLEIPAGRMIGDNGCAYSHLHLIVVRLRDRDGREGWGTWHGAARGRNLRPAEWFQDIPSEAELTADLEQAVMPVLRDRRADALVAAMPVLPVQHDLLRSTTQEAVWDLAAKQHGVPMWQYLGGQRDRLEAYGSLLDFPLGDDEAAALATSLVQRGFRTIKVKLGGTLERDLRRLQVVRQAVGPKVRLTGDANQAWTVDAAVTALATFAREGVPIAYIEDPMPPGDGSAFGELARRSGVPIAAHDYVLSPTQLEPLIAAGGVQKLRSRRWAHYARDLDQLARRSGLTATMTNSVFEIATHVAVAFPGFELVEFSDLAWNEFAPNPVRYENGCAVPPSAPGYGQEIRPADLERFHNPGRSTWRA
jgi:L-alanine-DL-glutamate epimerase-like enolase superfamily enzyme